MKFQQKSFVGGMSAAYDRTKTPEDGYTVGFNCRVRSNVVEGAYAPNRLKTPAGTLQAIFALDDKLILVVAGSVYTVNPDADVTVRIGTTLLSPTADVVYHENVPAPSSFFMRDSNGDLVYNSSVSTQPDCAVLQDGATQPVIITPSLSVRYARTYAQWSFSNPEYVPIGKQMCFSGAALYVVSPTGKAIYRSVSGRPLDFVVAIDDADGSKQGDASTTSIAVAAAALTAIVSAQAGGFIATTYYSTYAGIIDAAVDDQFGEPYIQPAALFPVGAVGPYAFTQASGETLFVSPAGIQSFNQTAQFLRSSNNTAVGAPISPYLVRPIEGVACATADDYVFFGLSTVFGDGIVVYDTRLNTFVSIDLVGKVKEFAVLRTGGIDRLFYITAANELFEMPLYGGTRQAFSIILGHYSTQTPGMQIRTNLIRASMTDVRVSGNITTRIFGDCKLVETQTMTLNTTRPDSNLLAQNPIVGIVGASATTTIVTLDFIENPSVYAIGVEFTCSADSKLTTLELECEEVTVDRPVVDPAISDETPASYFSFVGYAIQDAAYSGSSAVGLQGERLFLHNFSAPAWVANGGKKITTPQNIAKLFGAATNALQLSSGAVVYQYETLMNVLGRASNQTNIRFLLGDLGDSYYFAPVFEAVRSLGPSSATTIEAVLGPLDQTSIARNADFISQSKRPVRWIVETPYVNFYCLSIPLPEADMARDADGELIGPTPEQMLETGSFADFVSTNIAALPGKFNVVIIGYPPYSNCATFTPGFAALRWNFRRMGVHAVIANGRCYERFYDNSVYYINVGTGSKAALLETTVDGIAVPGFLEAVAFPNLLTFRFLDEDLQERDRAVIVI